MEKIDDSDYEKFSNEIRDLINESAQKIPIVLIVGMLDYMKFHLCSLAGQDKKDKVNYL